jgi:transposase
MEVVLVKRRFACTEAACPRRSFVEVSDQVPLRARLTTRPRAVVLEAVVTAGRVVAEVAAAHDLSWWTVQKVVNAAADVFTDPDDVPARRLGVDEHRYRSVRFFRDEHGAWRRYEPGGTSRSRGRMTTFVDAETAQVLGVVDGRDSAGVGTWLAARSCAWREGIEVVAIDPSAAFRRALRIVLRDTLTYELSSGPSGTGPLLAQVDAGCPVRMLR